MRLGLRLVSLSTLLVARGSSSAPPASPMPPRRAPLGVRQIDAQGQVREIVSGVHEVRGIAFDAKKNRLFFVDHEGATGGGDGTSTLIIRPL